jgi:DNA polymerase-3 subunit delta'
MPAKKTDGKNDEEDLDETARIEMAKQTQEKAANPYFHISIPRAVAITIDRIRQIRHESSMSAYEPGRKVFIISDADMLNEAAANALLKILEEPHPDTIFLLTTSKKEKLLPTIVSRCQAIRCEMLSEEEIAEALQKREAVPEERARFFARLAHGNYSRALELLFNDLLGEREAALQLLKAIISGSLLSIDECNDTHDVFSDRQAAERHLDLLRLWLRDLLLLREGHADGIINIDQLKILQQILVPSAHSDIVSGMKTIERALELLRRNVYLPLVLMYLTIHLRKALLYGQE